MLGLERGGRRRERKERREKEKEEEGKGGRNGEGKRRRNRRWKKRIGSEGEKGRLCVYWGVTGRKEGYVYIGSHW